MLGNGPWKFLRRWHTMAAKWPWENDEASFVRAQKALGKKFVLVFALDDTKIDNNGCRELLASEIGKFTVLTEDGTHDLPMLRPLCCAEIVEDAATIKPEATEPENSAKVVE